MTAHPMVKRMEVGNQGEQHEGSTEATRLEASSDDQDVSRLHRYKDILKLILKYSRSNIFQPQGLSEIEEQEQVEVEPGKPEELAADLEALGPTFVKLGQVLSSRPDLIAEPYVEALTRLQDDVAPVPFEIVRERLAEELGVRVSKAFSELEEKPMAAASLGQVHAAKLRDGRRVAVKVQRPNIRKIIASDLETLERVARVLDGHTEVGRSVEFTTLIDEFRKSLARELDYKVEADHLNAFAQAMEAYPNLVVPRPIADYSTERVLTMELVPGRKINKVHGVVKPDLDGDELADELFCAYLHQVLVEGTFHADPHPGNILLTPDHRIAILDLGMVGFVGRNLQDAILKILLAVSDGDGREVADHALAIGHATEDGDQERFRREIAQLVQMHRTATLDRIDVGRVVLELYRVATDCGIRVPPELSLLGKTLMQLSEVAECLAPDFDATRAIRRHALDVTLHRIRDGFSPGRVLAGALDARELLTQLPGDIRRLIDRVSEGSFSMELKPHGVDDIVSGLHRAANRVAAGLVLAALIVGAALMMRVETDFAVLGYPGIALLLFLAAAAGGGLLLWTIFWRDRRLP